jgi:hypothetical protein
MLELLMSEWEELLENEEYGPVHVALRAGISLLEKYYRRADDTDVYFIAHGMSHSSYHSYWLSIDMLISFGSCFQTWVPRCGLGTTISGSWDDAV